MTLAVTDVRGGAEHQKDEAAKALGQSSQRRAVFREIHSGKKRIKTVQEIAEATALPRKRVLEEAVKLVHKQILTKTRRDGDTAYQRDNFYYVHRGEIFRRADRLRRGRRTPKAVEYKPSRHRAGASGRRDHARTRSLPREDIFLCHASEDKAAIARPLYTKLKRARVSVWFDEATLTLGDNLRRKIDDGLARCRFAVVILSPRFFAKDWPQRELDGLVARENASGEKVILPIWHRVTKSQVARFSPMLAGLLAGKSNEGIPALVRKIKQVLESSLRRRRR